MTRRATDRVMPTGGRTPVPIDRPTRTEVPIDRPDPVITTPWPWGVGTHEGPQIAPPPMPDETQAQTILDNVVPMVFGTRKVVGHIGAWKYASNALSIGVVFSYGEQDSITLGTTYLNGEAINSPTFITSEAVHDGDGSTALSAVLTGMSGWVAADTTLWKKYAHAAMILNCQTGRVPQSFTIEATLGGMLIDASWRSGGSASTASTNPVEIAYFMMTDSRWKGLAAAKIDTDSWEAVADWCDDTMGDASARYEFNGIIAERDPDKAIAEVLGHCLTHTYIGDDGKIHLWAEMAPPSITGEWSATASVTITEDSTAGAATTELEADDWLYVGTDLRQVSSVTDDDTVVLKSAVTCSGAALRPISNVYIKKHDWQRPPAAAEASKLATPDKFRVRFADGANLGSHEVLSTYGAGTEKIIETTLTGCTSATVAARISETTLKVAWLQAYSWAGVVSNKTAAALEPGDVLLFDDDVLTQQPARVLPPIIANPDGTYMLKLREYDPSAYSESTDTTDTPPSLGTGWAANNNPVVTTIETVYSGTQYDLIGIGTSGIYDGRVVLGDTSRNTVLGSSDIRLPNNIPIYGLKTGGSTVEMLKMDGSDRLVLGDGSEEIFVNGTRVTVNDDVYISRNWSSKSNLIGYNSATDSVVVGITTDSLVLSSKNFVDFDIASAGSQFRGWLSGTASRATTTELPNDHDWCIWEETDTSTISWNINDGGNIRAVGLA